METWKMSRKVGIKARRLNEITWKEQATTKEVQNSAIQLKSDFPPKGHHETTPGTCSRTCLAMQGSKSGSPALQSHCCLGGLNTWTQTLPCNLDCEPAAYLQQASLASCTAVSKSNTLGEHPSLESTWWTDMEAPAVASSTTVAAFHSCLSCCSLPPDPAAV